MLFAIHWNLKYFKCDEFFRHIIEWCNLILRTHSNPNTCALWQPCTPCKESTPTAATAAASAAEIFFIKRYLCFVYEKANYITVNKNIINSSSISSKRNQCEAEHTEAFEPSHIFSCGSFLVFFFIFIWWKLTNATWKKWITSIIKCEFSKKQYDGIKSEQNTKKLDGTGRNIY